MSTAAEPHLEPGQRELKKLRGELWIILPFVVASGYFFLGSFRYKPEAATVPMVMGFATFLLVALRLFHILVPTSRIGQFREAGLAGEFDHLKDEIEEETLKGKHEEAPSRKITGRDERKAFLALGLSTLAFVLFGYAVGGVLVVITTARYYGYRRWGPILASAASVFVLLYVILHRLFGAEMSWGALLGPLLTALDLI